MGEALALGGRSWLEMEGTPKIPPAAISLVSSPCKSPKPSALTSDRSGVMIWDDPSRHVSVVVDAETVPCTHVPKQVDVDANTFFFLFATM